MFGLVVVFDPDHQRMKPTNNSAAELLHFDCTCSSCSSLKKKQSLFAVFAGCEEATQFSKIKCQFSLTLYTRACVRRAKQGGSSPTVYLTATKQLIGHPGLYSPFHFGEHMPAHASIFRQCYEVDGG